MDISAKLELLQTAKQAALKAGEIHLKYYGKKKKISYKSNIFDLVTNVDKEAEQAIIDTIKNDFNNHNIIAEESDKLNNDSDFEWIIDPLDGTTNYTHDFPHFCVSIALMYKNELYLGVVYDAFKKELFHGCKGLGSALNDEKITVSSVTSLSNSLLATGFPYDRDNKSFSNMEYFQSFYHKAQAIRRPGSAALDLCYVACGRLDGFWELKLAPWDTAAGALIVLESGGLVTNFFKDDFDICTKHIIASNPHIYNEMTEVIKATTPILPHNI